MVNAQSQTTSYTYDDAGNQTSVTDPNLHRTQQQYDARRRLQKTTYHDGTATQYSYDGPGNLTSVTDQASKLVQYTYDAANQLKSVVQVNHPDAAHNTTAYNCDNNGNLTTLTDANTHTTQNSFDLLNQLKIETMPSGTLTQTRNYDAAGNLISLTDYNGKTTTYIYDALNRLLTKTPDASLSEPAVSFTYTATGKRATMTDASGTTTYTYDNLDRLRTKATPQGTLTYTYDTAGNVASITSSNTNGVSVGYTYDNLNRLATVVDNRLPVGQNTTNYVYDPASNLATVTYPNGLQSSFTYDTLNRVTVMNATRASYNYTLGPAGNRLSQTSTLPGISTGTFSYDVNDRLATETYDNNGNTTVSGARTFAYDFENRLKSMNAGAVTLQYDGDGNRVAKTVGGVSTRYLVDDLNPTSYTQVVEELVGGVVQRTYTYGIQRISQNQLIASTWTPSFYGYDGFGSVRFLTDLTATVTDTYDYDAWGNTVDTSGSAPNVYRYRGEQYDADLALYYLRARYMNPTTGRFLSIDPAEGNAADPASFHRYLYTSADPVNATDPRGLSNDEDNAGGTAFFTTLAGGYSFLMPGRLIFPRSTITRPGCLWRANPSEEGGTGTQIIGSGYSPMAAAPVPRPGPILVPRAGPRLVPPPPPQPGAGLLDLISDALSMTCRVGGLLLSTASPAGGPEEQVLDQRQREYEAYKNACREPYFPPDMDPCAKLSRLIDYFERCVRLRAAWDEKWQQGRHSEEIQNVWNRIKKWKEQHNRECTQNVR